MVNLFILSFEEDKFFEMESCIDLNNLIKNVADQCSNSLLINEK